MSNPTEESRAIRPAAGAAADVPSPILRRLPTARPHRVEPREPTLAELAWRLAERRWTVLAITAVAVTAGVAYLFAAPPVYESSVLVQVEGRARPAAPEAVVQLFDTAPPAEAEMRLLRSRALLDSVVDALGLDIEAHPRHAPFVGAALARRWKGGAPAPAPFGLVRFGWGGERLQVAQLEVPDALVDEPLALVARGEGQYELTAGDVRLTGRVGVPAVAGDGADTVRVLVSGLTARPDTEFVLKKLRRVELIDRLQKALRVTEQGRPGGLVEVALSGPDPRRVATILETLAATYVRQSLDRTSAEAASTLRILEGRLAALRSDVGAAELALTRFHQRNQGVNLSVDARRLVAQLGDLDRAVTEAELDDADLAAKHTVRFPEGGASPEQRAQQLRDQRRAVEAQIAALPGLELEYARLTRKVGTATERYGHVLDRVEELRAAKSGWLGNARLVEHAVERHVPVSPRKSLVLALAMLIGLGAGVALVLVGSAFDEGVRDPDDIEARTGLPVFATIPRSATQRGIGRRSRRARLDVLSVVDPSDGAVEELRALRTGVQYALDRTSTNVIAVCSPAPAAGKSFVAVNLAHLLAGPDARVLVVDGDLRRPILHRYFGLQDQPGLSDILTGEATLETAIHRTSQPDVDVLPAGRRVGNPAELLSGAPFARLLEQVRGRYRLVVVDTPPILSVTDGALVGRHAGVNILVVRAQQQTTGELELALKRLVRNGVTVRGAVLNDIRPTLGRYGKSGHYRRYDARRA